jgi:hypothetical protein
MALAGTIILAGLGGCAVTDVEAAWQSTHFSRSPGIADWSRGMEQTVKGWLPGVGAVPEIYASRVN